MSDAKKIRFFCCHADCEKDAEFEIHAMGKGVDPYDITHACADHVGHLLGSITEYPADHWIVMPRFESERPYECPGPKRCWFKRHGLAEAGTAKEER